MRNRVLLQLAYDTLARRSELIALDLADLEDDPAGHGTITIRRSKTDQEGAGMVRYIAPDTMQNLRAWRGQAQLDDGLVLPAANNVGVIGGPLDTGNVDRIFKEMALAAGIGPDEVARISGHSSRIDAAQDMVRFGMELPAGMQAGGWRTAEMVGVTPGDSTPAAAAPPRWRCRKPAAEPGSGQIQQDPELVIPAPTQVVTA